MERQELLQEGALMDGIRARGPKIFFIFCHEIFKICSRWNGQIQNWVWSAKNFHCSGAKSLASADFFFRTVIFDPVIFRTS